MKRLNWLEYKWKNLDNMKTLISRLTMKRKGCAIHDSVSRIGLYYYVDKYGDEYMANYPFYIWSYRYKIN